MLMRHESQVPMRGENIRRNPQKVCKSKQKHSVTFQDQREHIVRLSKQINLNYKREIMINSQALSLYPES